MAFITISNGYPSSDNTPTERQYTKNGEYLYPLQYGEELGPIWKRAWLEDEAEAVKWWILHKGGYTKRIGEDYYVLTLDIPA